MDSPPASSPKYRHSGASRNLDVRRYVRSLDSGFRRNDQEHVQTKSKHALDSGLRRNDKKSNLSTDWGSSPMAKPTKPAKPTPSTQTFPHLLLC